MHGHKQFWGEDLKLGRLSGTWSRLYRKMLTLGRVMGGSAKRALKKLEKAEGADRLSRFQVSGLRVTDGATLTSTKNGGKWFDDP